MKKLTMNRLAFSGIRANKKDYLLLGISAFLAIFAAVSTVLGTLALMQAATGRRNGAYGSEDAFVFNVHSVPENIPGVRQYGCVTVLGQVKDFPVGYYDEAAQRILNRRCMEGRLPEKAGEAAVDLTALERLQPGAQVGDSLVVPFTVKGKTETRQYRIVGILQPQFADDTREDFLSAVPDSSLAMPEILVSSQEGGSAVNRHLVVIFSGKGGMEALSAAFPENSCRGVDWFGGIYETEPFYGFWAQFRENINISASLLLGGACLLGGSLIGILEATLTGSGSNTPYIAPSARPGISCAASAAGRPWFCLPYSPLPRLAAPFFWYGACAGFSRTACILRPGCPGFWGLPLAASCLSGWLPGCLRCFPAPRRRHSRGRCWGFPKFAPENASILLPCGMPGGFASTPWGSWAAY